MGLFSKKKKIYVSSSLYNLAGDINKRTQILPTTIATKIISHSEESMSSAITRSLLKGAGLRFRSYARWAREKGYNNAIGLSATTLYVGDNIDLEKLQLTLPVVEGATAAVQTAEIGVAGYGYWVDQWMLDNHPTEIADDYEIDFKEDINTIFITFADEGRVYSFQPVGFNPLGVYLYYSWVYTKSNIAEPKDEGPEIIVDKREDWPSVVDWTLTSSNSVPKTVSLTKTTVRTVSYSDGRPDEVTTDTQTSQFTGNEITSVYERDFYQGLNEDESTTSTIHRWLTLKTSGKIESNKTTAVSEETIAGGVVKTTTTEVTEQSVSPQYSYIEDEQLIINSSTSRMRVGIYRRGTNTSPVLESMFKSDIDAGAFVPFVPVRVNNRNITSWSGLYPWNKKAIKKAMDKKYDFLTSQLNSNPQLGEIDYAYCVFGVSLNTKENAGRKYIMRFFQMLNTIGGGAAGKDTAWVQWELAWQRADAIQKAWLEWKNAQKNPFDPLYGKPQPPRATYPAQPYRTIRQYAGGVNYNMTLGYGGIRESRVSGQYPGLRVGKTVFKLGASENSRYQELLLSSGIRDSRTLDNNTVIMYWQDQEDSYLVITVSSLWHNYIIYGGKGVDTYTYDAMTDSNESAMLIPLHEGVFRALSLPDATQLATSCAYMVCNSYKVVKKKWYQSSWFKIVLIVVVIVIVVLTWGGGSAAGAGILGTNAAVGASIGLAGTAAILAGAAVNAIAGFIVAQIITAASTALFGEEVGLIVGAIASVAALSAGTSLATGGTAAQGLSNVASASNLIKASASIANGYTKILEGKIDSVAQDVADIQEKYKSKMMEIYDAWTANLGNNNATIDITALTESARMNYYAENLNDFLTRTLMTGTDIAETTNGLIGQLVPSTITTKLPL